MSLRDGDIVTVDPAAVSLLMVPTAEDAAVTVDGTVGEAKEAPEAATSAAEGVSAASDAVEGSASKEGEASAAVEEVIATEGEQTGDPESGKSETSAGGRSRKGSWNSNGAHQSPASKHAWMKQTGKPLAFTPHAFMGPFTFVPEYLEVDYNICSAVFLRAPTLHPGRCEVPTPYPPEHHALTFEWYSRIYNRKTKRAPPEPMVIHGQPVKLKDKFRRILEHEAKQRSALFERTAAEAERERILATSAAMIGGNVGKQPEARL